jgi:hypothetical protein
VIDPVVKQHYQSAMGWIQFAANDAMQSDDRDFAEQMTRELNGLNIRLAQKFGFQLRTGKVVKMEKPIPDG